MAATCVARPSESCQPKTQKSMTGWAKIENQNRQFLSSDKTKGRDADTTYPSRIGGRWRYLVHSYTANSSPPPTITARSTNSTPISRSIHHPSTDIHSRASVLVAELLYSIANTPAAYGALPPGYHDEDSSQDPRNDHSLARACIVTDASAPLTLHHKAPSSSSNTPSARNMDFGFDWGGSGGFQTRGKKKKTTTAANKFDAFGDDEEKKDDGGANGAGGDDGLGGSGSGGASGAGGGDDNNNGGGDDDDTWGFSTGTKKKKKTKKQLEEEEEERKRKEEEEAQAASNTNALSWADDANDDKGNDDWTMSWGGAKTKGKKTTTKKNDAPPAVPDAPNSAFQDISLDDGAPKLDFTFDNLGDTKKAESGSGFGTWGKTWDFGTIGNKEEKKEETSDLGANNPWGFGSKTKKKTTTSGFDFGTDFGNSTNNDLSFDTHEDVADTKPADDAWGFGGIGKKDKKKKAVEEIKEEPEADQKEDWGAWSAQSTATGTKKSSKKKSTFDDAFAITEEEPNTNGDGFDWGFGKDKTKNLISEVDEKPADDGDDLMSGAWGAVGKKKTSKKTTNDFSTSFDLTSNNVTDTTNEPGNDLWSSFGGKKDTKAKKNILDEFLVEEAEPANEPEPAKEPLVAWDFGLNIKDKKKKQRTMEKEGTWEARITQEMVEAEEARLAANPEPEPEPEPEPAVERVAWDHGLDAKARRKLQKEMQMNGTWGDRVTQEMIDEEKRAAEEAAAAAWTKEPDPEPLAENPPEFEVLEDTTPLEDLVAWDHGLSAKDKKKKEKQMRLDQTWEDRLTQEQIDEKKEAAARAAEEAAAVPEPEPEILNEPEPEADTTPLEDLRPWDDGLTPVRKRKLEKQMRADGTWEDRLTQEKIDDMIAAAAAKAEESKELEPEPIPEPEPEAEEDATPLEDLVAWDHGLTPKEKRKKEKDMIKDGTWDNRLTQEKIDEKVAAAAAKKAEEEAQYEPEPEPEVVEERRPWDYGLTPKEKKRKEKEMKLDYTWEDRLTQEMIDDEAAAAEAAKIVDEPEPEEPPPPPVEVEPRFPWDHGLSAKDKKKKEKEMRLKGTWENRLTQEKIDEEAAEAAAKAAEPEPEPAAEEAGGWGFGWGATKPKSSKKSLLDPEPTPKEEKADEGWGGSWGLGFGKDKDKSKKKKEEDVVPEPEADLEPEPQSTKDKKDDLWGYASPATTSSAKKKKDKTVKKSDAFDSLLEEAAPEPEPAPAAEDDLWAQFSKPSDKKTTTTKKTKKGEEAPPPAPSPPDLGFSADAEKEVADVPPIDEFNWGGLDNGRKSTKSAAAETPAKKSSSSMWGFGSATASTSKTKKDKDVKSKKESEEKAKREEQEEKERIQRENDEAEAAAKAEADRLAEEEAAEAAKAAKKTKAGKLTKSSSKTEDKKKTSDLLDLLDEPVPTPATSSSKLKKTPTRTSASKIEEDAAEEKAEATDYFSFWGATSNAKKVAGKKTPEAKKETKTPVLTNDEDALLAELNDDEIQAILDDAPAPASPKLTRTTSSSKSARSSINNRINSSDGKKEATGKTPKTSETVLSKEIEAEDTLTPKEVKKATKSKSSTRSSKVQFEAPPSPEPELVELKKSKESVPGSFPGAFEDDDAMLNLEDPASDADPTPTKSKAKKSTKVEKKSFKVTPKKKTSTKEETREIVAEPESIDELDLLDGSAPKLPTPPPEDDSKTSKPAKKERARVERSATGSWALWGAQPTPKKLARSKTVDDVSPPSTKAKSPPAMVRSRSTKTPKKDDLDDSKGTEPSKTSGSDKESSSKPSDKSKPSRGLTFTNFMMGSAPPSAMRTNNLSRRNSTSGSKGSATPTRRQSVDYNGLMSPPPDESPVAKSAAKLMGFAVGKPSRRSSVKGKSSSYADPYPIDDDDMVMINPRKEAESSSRSKLKNKIDTEGRGDSKRIRSKTISGDEDVVMVDSPVAVESDFERPQLQRSNTSRSAKGFFGSFFSPAVKTPLEKPRSAQVTDNEETTPRNRSRNTSKRRSRVVSPADEVTTDAQGETDVDAARRRARRAAKEQAEEDERQARESRRRERREREKADLEARQQRAREQARKEREAEEQRREERRARRKEKEAAERERLAQEEAEAQAAAERRREERKRRLEAEATINPLSKDDRRRTYGGEDEMRRKGERTKVRSGRRSTALMAEYHESRNGSGRGIKPPADKTSSWIDSQQEEPPELPPVEGTVLDESGQQPRPVDDADQRRRRKDKYAGMTEDEIARHRAKRRERRIVEKSTSGGSDEKQQGTPAKRSSKRQSKVYEDDYYADQGRTFDGRPQQTKRTSFLGKFF